MGKEEEERIPFQLGECVECTSFADGYRGAWFRSEILQFRSGKLGLRCMLKYLDFDADARYKHKIYQRVPWSNQKKKLMLRPQYPSNIAFNRDWVVGDYAEFLYEFAFWECQIIEVYNTNEFKIECTRSPVGQGGIYRAHREALRPGLEWSLENGWRLKTNKFVKAGPLVNFVDFQQQQPTVTGALNGPDGAAANGQDERPEGAAVNGQDERPEGAAVKGPQLVPENDDIVDSSVSSEHCHEDYLEVQPRKKKKTCIDDKQTKSAEQEQSKSMESKSTVEDQSELSPVDLAYDITDTLEKVIWLKEVLLYGVRGAMEFRSTVEWELHK